MFHAVIREMRQIGAGRLAFERAWEPIPEREECDDNSGDSEDLDRV